MAAFCPYCHLPVSSKERDKNYCCYGCSLAAALDGPQKKLTILRLLTGTLLSLFVLLIPFTAKLAPGLVEAQANIVRLILLTIAVLLLGLPLFKFALGSLLQRRLGAEILLALAIGLSFGTTLYSLTHQMPYLYFNLTAALLILPLVVHLFEASYRKKSCENILRMEKLKVSEANLMKRNQAVSVPASTLKKGDIIQVLAGERIPSDGIVVSGSTRVNESVFTGEPANLLKEKGDFVTGGTLNGEGTILIEISHPPEQNFLTRLIHLTRDVLRETLVRQKRIHVFSQILIAAVLILTAVIFYLYGQNQFSIAINRALSILIVPSICILYHTAPMTIAIALGQVLGAGILVRSESLFEKLGQLKTLFFDKTGTLTRGEFVFSRLLIDGQVNQGTLLSTIFSLEARSSHPLAQGMKTHPWYLEIPIEQVKDYKYHPGLGLSGIICERDKPDRFAVVGNMRFLKRNQMYITRTMRERIEESESMGETVLLCGWEGQVRGLISFVDTLRTDVKEMLLKLKKLKINPVMITGDHGEGIAHLTYAHGLNQIYTRCLPEEKVRKIKKQQERGKVVGMIANPQDDSTPLIQADVGIIIGAGTQELNENAGVFLFGHRFQSLTALLSYSRKTINAIKGNLSVGFIYSIVGVTLASVGLLNPNSALLVMTAMSLILAIQPLRLKRALIPESSEKELKAQSSKGDRLVGR